MQNNKNDKYIKACEDPNFHESRSELIDHTKQFEGWPNRPTWCLHQWTIESNDDQDETRELTRQAWGAAAQDPNFNPNAKPDAWNAQSHLAAGLLAESIESFWRDSLPDEEWPGGFFSDLLEGALSRVDWFYFAKKQIEWGKSEGWLFDATEDEEEDE